MSDILSYLSDFGDKTFAEQPFGIADNFCLSALSYFDVSPVGDRISGGSSMTIHDMVGALDLSAVETRGLVTFPVVFMQLMAASKRFGDTLVSDYTEIMDTERECQFAAFRYTMSDGAAYFAFRGTDASVIGWKEDFLLACGETAAQRSAVKWLEHAIKGVRRRRPCYVGGHSKGGNLAVYAGAYCNEETFERITTVYSNDGPGLCRDWTPDSRIERVRPPGRENCSRIFDCRHALPRRHPLSNRKIHRQGQLPAQHFHLAAGRRCPPRLHRRDRPGRSPHQCRLSHLDQRGGHGPPG